jgi:hypothetical protein
MSGSDASGALFVSGEMKPQMEAISTMRLGPSRESASAADTFEQRHERDGRTGSHCG